MCGSYDSCGLLLSSNNVGVWLVVGHLLSTVRYYRSILPYGTVLYGTVLHCTRLDYRYFRVVSSQ